MTLFPFMKDLYKKLTLLMAHLTFYKSLASNLLHKPLIV